MVLTVGKFGKILTFQVFLKPEWGKHGVDSRQNYKVKCLTVDGLRREVSNQTTEHSRMLKKPKVQFNGPALDSMTFTIRFSAELGVNPRKMINNLEKSVRLGWTGYFIVGRKKVGRHKYLITNMSESWDHVIKNGKLVAANVDITMKEYV